MIQYKKILMTLALLLTAVTGAWADGTVTVKELTASEITAWANDATNITAADLPGFVEATTEQAQSWDGYPTNGTVYLIYGFDNGEMKKITYVSGNAMSPSQNPKTRAGVYGDINRSTPERYFYVTGITGVVEPALTVEWNASTKTGTFTMPAFDVEIAPIYAPTAMFATDGNLVLTPTAIEGIYAESTDAIVKAGTVAKIGETENVQGTLMYAVGTSATEQPALTAFSATLPTAKDITTASDVWVWYYIKGADTPEGQTATAENTFNDSEICETPIKVTLLSNKFDITFKAANDNTIEAGKATVTVGGTAATVTEGKLEGVKMGSEVKMTAKEGYKFRKVEVKKAVPVSLTYATKEGAVTRIKFNYGGNVYYADFTYSNGSFTRTGGSNGYTFSGSWTMKEENGVLTMTANYNEMNEQFIYFVCTIYVDTNEYTESSTGIWNISFRGIEVNGNDITDQLTKVK